jgi:hypothetical protein
MEWMYSSPQDLEMIATNNFPSSKEKERIKRDKGYLGNLNSLLLYYLYKQDESGK